MSETHIFQPLVAAIIVAGGRGSRAADPADDRPKQYRTLAGKPVIARTLCSFRDHPRVTRIVTVIHRDDADAFADAVSAIGGPHESAFGGATRQASVLAGLEALAGDPPDIVLIHDAARPFVSAQTIDRVVDALAEADGAIAALPVVDTLKRQLDCGTEITETIPRAGLWGAQTPQGFDFAKILTAHRRAATESANEFTDDAAVAEWAGLTVRLVEGNTENTKLTTAEDLMTADTRLRREDWTRLADIRVGTGYDVHAFADGDAVTLGGVAIPHTAKLAGHSDADVGLHALTDALFGALGEGDIGSHFPPSDPQWKGAPSDLFLKEAVASVTRRGGIVAHLDLTLICEAPKIGPHREEMRARIAETCGIAADRVSVKATTTEKLGFTGRREGIAAMASATVRLPLED
ncbi:MAG: bifunctional 2-C-methyl-D-erythritol 4-phosphate cytidylyltransferase/2-C-methyl-D-erythritol 2,4-cyclodiphosphate synthase [Hyphomicrobiales bacterium]|nr:MAG: bifunctional 2-C-methyl-D-erythritol 4-phosphate cytidylyltransferase/2-C-methyl-D-erythritol 2,4-cyclodiphosphate synthase [Hyphomicrobiales bacterium]